MPLVSRLPRRTRPVTEADFEGVDRLNYLGKDKVDYLLSQWNERIPLMPYQIVSLFDQLEPYGFVVEIDVNRSGEFSLDVKLGTEDYASRFIDFTAMEYIHSDMRLNSVLQKRGIGRFLAGIYTEFAAVLGLKRIEFTATNAMGGYVWAKMGAKFDFVFGAMQEPAKLRNLILERLKTINGLIPQEIYTRVEELVDWEDPDAIHQLAILDLDVSDLIDPNSFVSDGEFVKNIAGQFRKKGQTKDEEALKTHLDRIQNIIGSCKEKEIPLTLGKFLLAGQSYPAVFDYMDMKQMKYLADYVGGLQFTDIVPDQLREPIIPAQRIRKSELVFA